MRISLSLGHNSSPSLYSVEILPSLLVPLDVTQTLSAQPSFFKTLSGSTLTSLGGQPAYISTARMETTNILS